MAKLVAIIAVVILAVVGQHICRFILALNPFHHTYNHSPGPCQQVPGITTGSEDLALTSTGRVFVSSGPDDRHGKLFTMDLNSPDVEVSQVSIQPESLRDNFVPVGISVYEDPASKEIRLFVVNFKSFEIETFRYDSSTNTAHHIKTIKHPLITSPNDIVATGPDSFYVTNMSFFSNLIFVAFSLLTFLPVSSVTYYNNGEARTVADGIKFANGINMSPDGQVIYVASPLERGIKVYHRRPDNSLEFKNDIMVYSAVDNVNVDPTSGSLRIGAHPSFWQAVGSKSPGSQVLQVKHAESSNPVVTSIYANNGKELSKSSAAVYHKGHLLIGTVSNKMLHCKVNIPI
ncbi:serum paraoxonase/arylesterase 2-like [Branchiostoma lanceolatum]|uniref:serum paraoxonase/arylesterase 2-like n=1 Tax=Branchiostoma lanceolatum TaxID=7740 RepID=UPI0034526CF8